MEENVKSLLLASSLSFDSTNNFVYCITCKVILLCNAKRHVSRYHHQKITKKAFQIVQDFLLLNPPNLTVYNLVKKTTDLEPLCYLQIFKGFKCLNCFYCYIEESCYRKHQCNSPIINKAPKYLQSFNVLNHSPFFSVINCTSDDATLSGLPNVAKVATSMILKAKLPTVLPFETNSALLKIYSMFGWYSANDTFWNLDFKFILLLPQKETDVMFEIRRSLDTIFQKWIRNINLLPLSIRIFIISEGKDLKAQAFNTLQEKDSLLKYSKFWVKIFFVIIRLFIKRNEIFLLPEELSVEISALLCSFNDDEFLNRVFKICWFLISQESSEINGFGCLVYIFKILCVTDQKCLISTEHVSQNSAIVKYFIRTVVSQKILSQQIVSLNEFDEDVKKLIAHRPFNIYTSFCQILMTAYGICNNEKRMPTILSNPNNPMIMVVNGCELNFEVIKIMINNVYQDAENILNELMFEYKTDFFSINNIQDNWTNDSPGYSMQFGNNLTECLKIESLLLFKIISTPKLHNSYIDSLNIPLQTYIFKEKCILKYLDKCWLFQELILVLIHILSGQPSRGTELALLRYSNGRSNLRNLFKHFDKIAFITEYSKVRWKTKNENINVKFLDSRCSELVFKYLGFVRPLEKVFCKFLKMDLSEYNSYFFIHSGKAINSRQVSNVFKKIVYSYTGIALGFLEYRHVAKHLCDTVLNIVIEDEETENDIFDTQRGHSSQVASHIYGKSNLDFKNVRFKMLQLFYQVSEKWH